MPGIHSPAFSQSTNSRALSVDQLFTAAFSKSRSPRSAEYKAGVRAALAFRIDGVRMPQPYALGTAQDDAYFAGMAEGHALWRAALESNAGGAA